MVIDAGPSLTFFGAGYEHLLLDTLEIISGDLHMPDVVREEVRHKSKLERRFRGVDRRVDRVEAAGTLHPLSDSQDDDGELVARAALFQRKLAALAGRGREPLSRADLGEAMVMAHAATIREAGTPTYVIIDEWRGQKVANDAKLQILTTETILLKAAKLGFIEDVAAMRAIWNKLEPLDESLRPWRETTRLHNAGIYGTEAHLLKGAKSADVASSSA